MAKIREKAKSSLLKATVCANPCAQINAAGYVQRLEENLIEGVSRELFETDFSAGAGRELGAKMRASHSSAALVVNSFAPWRMNPKTLLLADATGFDSLRFEVPFPTCLLGTSPHLDLVAFGSEPVAVESKCIEYLTPKRPEFSPAYDTIADARRDSAWFKLIEKLRSAPFEFQFLDVAQLVKHSLGLMKSATLKDITLLYLYWEPSNHADFPEFQVHRQEIAS